MNTEAKIRELIEVKKELHRMYKHAVHRAQDIRTRVLPPEKEEVRKKILARYNLDKLVFNRQINEIGDEIWRLQHEGND
ncbi:MAG: hypothetical protein IKM02_05480 [Clostridia bacterium]|nr:hypothetical protein [Clostridia bacterium]